MEIPVGPESNPRLWLHSPRHLCQWCCYKPSRGLFAGTYGGADCKQTLVFYGASWWISSWLVNLPPPKPYYWGGCIRGGRLTSHDIWDSTIWHLWLWLAKENFPCASLAIRFAIDWIDLAFSNFSKFCPTKCFVFMLIVFTLNMYVYCMCIYIYMYTIQSIISTYRLNRRVVESPSG